MWPHQEWTHSAGTSEIRSFKANSNTVLKPLPLKTLQCLGKSEPYQRAWWTQPWTPSPSTLKKPSVENQELHNFIQNQLHTSQLQKESTVFFRSDLDGAGHRSTSSSLMELAPPSHLKLRHQQRIWCQRPELKNIFFSGWPGVFWVLTVWKAKKLATASSQLLINLESSKAAPPLA